LIGVIPNILVDMVQQNWGREMVERIHAEAGIDHTDYHLDVYYPEEEWERLYAKTIELVDMDRDEFEWAFGRYSGEYLKRQFGGFMKGANHARDMITRQPRIHNTLAMSFRDTGTRDAINQKFRLEEFEDHTVMHYNSPNHLCTYYRALADWVAEQYETPIEIEEPLCMKRGDHECEIHVRYLAPQGA
jgi:hypothetical protein